MTTEPIESTPTARQTRGNMKTAGCNFVDSDTCSPLPDSNETTITSMEYYGQENECKSDDVQ
jgi:hypothetical protein